MWIVVDAYEMTAIGPFNSLEAAEEWLAGQGVYDGQHTENQVGIGFLQDPKTYKLTPIEGRRQ